MTIRLDTINLFIKDMRKTLEFYHLLGFTFPEDDFSKDYVKIEFDSISLCFYTEKTVKEYFKKESFHSSPNHQYELSFRVEKPDTVDLLYDKLIKRGHPSIKSPNNSDWNQRTAFVTDPDNNLIEICSFLNKSN